MKAGRSGDWVKGAERLWLLCSGSAQRLLFVNPSSSDLSQIQKGETLKKSNDLVFPMVSSRSHRNDPKQRGQDGWDATTLGRAFLRSHWFLAPSLVHDHCRSLESWDYGATFVWLYSIMYCTTIYRKLGTGEIGRTFWWNYDEMLDGVELDVQMFNRNLGTWDHETGFNMAYDVLFKMFAHVCSVIWSNLWMHFFLWRS